MTVEVTQPTEGRVVLDLSWDEAVIAARAIGMMNSGNMKENGAHTLEEFVRRMVAIVGRNSTSEAQEYIACILNGQVFVDPVE